MPADSSTRPYADLASGLFFIIFGSATILWSLTFELGTAMRIGPGVFPSIAGALSIIVGTLLAIKSTVAIVHSGGRRSEGHAFAGAIRPLVCIAGALAFFALSIEVFGLIIAVFGAAMISSFGGKQFRVFEAALLATCLSVGSVVIFVFGLGLPVPIAPW